MSAARAQRLTYTAQLVPGLVATDPETAHAVVGELVVDAAARLVKAQRSPAISRRQRRELARAHADMQVARYAAALLAGAS